MPDKKLPPFKTQEELVAFEEMRRLHGKSFSPTEIATRWATTLRYSTTFGDAPRPEVAELHDGVE
jgi:hypothetical protein